MNKVILLNKPFNVLSQFTDRPTKNIRINDTQNKVEKSRGNLSQYISNSEVKVAGRLDRDSEGLLVLTNSGELAHKITSPDKQMTKTYWAQVEGDAKDEQLNPLREGVELADGLCKPARCFVMAEPHHLWPRVPPIRKRKTIPTSWLNITISEGRNRQVRRMCAAIQLPVLRLIRYRVGSWTIDGIEPGEMRECDI